MWGWKQSYGISSLRHRNTTKPQKVLGRLFYGGSGKSLQSFKACSSSRNRLGDSSRLLSFQRTQIISSVEIRLGSMICAAAAAAAKSLQSCLTLCDPMDGSPPSSAIPGILQARPLEWAAISFSNA